MTTVRESARRTEPDRYAAALLAPSAVRDDLIALAAFAGDVRRIGQDVRDPMAGEIRLQWWRDALTTNDSGSATGNPIADAFQRVMRRYDLSQDALHGCLDAHAHALYAEAPPDQEALTLEIDLKEGTLFRFASRILSGSRHDDELIKVAAQAYGLMRVMLDLPYALARGRVPVPSVDGLAATQDVSGNNSDFWRGAIRDVAYASRAALERARRGYPACQQPIKTALLPVALVEPYLKALERGARDPANNPARDIADIAPVTRLWRLYCAHMRGQI